MFFVRELKSQDYRCLLFLMLTAVPSECGAIRPLQI